LQRERAVETWLRTGGSLAAAVGGFRGALLGAELDALTIEGDAPAAHLCHRRRARHRAGAPSRGVPHDCSVRSSVSFLRATTGAVLAVSWRWLRPAPVHQPRADRLPALAPACAATPQDAWTLAQQAVATGDAGLVTERLSPDFAPATRSRWRSARRCWPTSADVRRRIGSARRPPRPRPPRQLLDELDAICSASTRRRRSRRSARR
jgi:hypothetical protein